MKLSTILLYGYFGLCSLNQQVDAQETIALSRKAGGLRRARVDNRNLVDEDIICKLFVAVTEREEDDDMNEVLCDLENFGDINIAHGLEIDLNPLFIDENRADIESGTLKIRITGGHIVHETNGGLATRVAVPREAEISVMNHRTLQSTPDAFGARKVMIFRVTTDDEAVSVPASEIADTFFDRDRYSLTTQYESCSFGAIAFEPHDPSNPVTEIRVPLTSSSYSRYSLFRAVTAVAEDMLGSSLSDITDHAVFCMPPSLGGVRFKATSALNQPWTIANNTYCSHPAAMVHEFGHNMGLGHAAEDDWEYGDKTSMMGSHAANDFTAAKCFNGQNFWHFGWFADRSVELGPLALIQGAQKFELATFVDYNKTATDQVVVIKVFDLYLVYNRAKAFNSETSEFRDAVTIVQETDLHSYLLGGIDEDNSVYIHPSPSPLTAPLVFEVCKRTDGSGNTPDLIEMAIGYESSPCTSMSTSASTSTSMSTSTSTSTRTSTSTTTSTSTSTSAIMLSAESTSTTSGPSKSTSTSSGTRRLPSVPTVALFCVFGLLFTGL